MKREKVRVSDLQRERRGMTDLLGIRERGEGEEEERGEMVVSMSGCVIIV